MGEGVSTVKEPIFRLDQNGEFDEFFASNAFVHIERMNERGFWIGITPRNGHTVHVNTGAYRGKWYFRIEDADGGDGHVVERSAIAKKAGIASGAARARKAKREKA